MKNIIKINARGTFLDGKDVSHLHLDVLAAAIKVKLGLPDK